MHSISPTQMAFMRLYKNKLSLFGGVLVLFMIIFCVFGPYIFADDASTIRLFFGARPPLFSHPDSASQVMLTANKKPRGLTLDEGKVEIKWQKQQIQEIRIVLRRGKVKSIQYQKDAKHLNKIKLNNNLIIVGQKPPVGLFKPHQRVLIVRQKKSFATHITHFDIDKTGIVKNLQTANSTTITLKAENIIYIKHNNKLKTIIHLLGTDELGRDLLQRIMLGGRVSLLVGIVATLVSLIIGVLYGTTAAYMGGLIDKLMMGLVDILYALPFIFLVLLLMVIFDRNILLLFLALGLVQWLTMARIVRGQVLSLINQDYIQAAKLSGASVFKILYKHIVPHTLGTVIVFTTLMVPTVILEESFLAFIGLPVQYQGTTLDSWGSLVHQGSLALGESGQKYWLLLFPSLAMVFTLFGLNALGDGLRDAFDPKTKV